MILLTGATGTVGAHTVAALQQAGAPFSVLTRNPDKATACFGADVPTLAGDIGSLTSEQIHGISALMLLSPALETLGADEQRAITAAQAADVGHVVKLSAWQADSASPVGLVRQHGTAEQVLRQSGLPYTIVQGQYFLENLLGAGPAVAATGRLSLPMGMAVCAPLAATDFGAVLARVLLDGPSAHAGRTYQLTGPALVSFADIAYLLAITTGRAVVYEPLLVAEFRRQLISWGIPAWLAEDLGDVFVSLAGGDAARLTPDVRRVLGRDPQGVADFLTEHRATFLRA